MTITETMWLNTNDVCSFEYIIKTSGIQREHLTDLIEAGVIHPSRDQQGNDVFHTECIMVARQARRLRDDFELDRQGLALAMTLLKRIRRLEAQLDDLQAHMPRMG